MTYRFHLNIFVYENSFSSTSKDVIVQLTKEWIEPEHHSVTLNSPLIPFGFAVFGVVVVLFGVGLTVLGIVRKDKHLPQPPP